MRLRGATSQHPAYVRHSARWAVDDFPPPNVAFEVHDGKPVDCLECREAWLLDQAQDEGYECVPGAPSLWLARKRAEYRRAMSG